MLKTKINGIIAGVKQNLAIDLMGPADPNGLGIIHAVIDQAAQQSLQGRPARRPGQTHKRLYLLLRKPRNLISRLPLAYPGKAGKYGLNFFALGAATLQMGKHLLALFRRNYVSHVVGPIGNVEMAHLSHIDFFFISIQSVKGNTASGSAFPFLAVDG